MLLYKLTNQMSAQQVRGRGNSRSEKNRFLIKVRQSSRENQENRQETVEVERATDSDVMQFIAYMMDRSQRLREMVQRRAIHNEEAFYQKHLVNSVCLKTILKQILDKMIADRRLGKNLKGMNKSNLTEIENAVWPIVEREASLYIGELDYQRQRKALTRELNSRKEELLREINRLSGLKETQQDNFMLTTSLQQ